MRQQTHSLCIIYISVSAFVRHTKTTTDTLRKYFEFFFKGRKLFRLTVMFLIKPF